MTKFSFSKKDRLLKQADFVRLKKIGRKAQAYCFIAQIQKNNLENSRLGVTISKKAGGAVIRNRLKRLVRERFRAKRHTFFGVWDINIVAKKNIAQCSSEKVVSSLDEIFTAISNNYN